VCYTPLKIYFQGISNIVLALSKINLIGERYKLSKFWDNKSPSFESLTWEFQGKVTFGCNLYGKAHNIL
jgi:hypothetical protein